MRILISNLVSLNGGDAAIAFGMMKALKAAFGDDTSFIIGDSAPEVAGALYPDLDFVRTLGISAVSTKSMRFVGRYLRKAQFARYRLAAAVLVAGSERVARALIGGEAFRTMKLYRDATAVISCGGTYLREDYGVASQLADYELAFALGKPIVFYTQSIGAFRNHRTREALRKVFDRALLILVRDEESRNNLADTGVDSRKVHIRADAAFALADPAVLQCAKFRTLPVDRPLRVAVSVLKWRHFIGKTADQGSLEYMQAIAQAIDWLVSEMRAQVLFLSTCQSIAEYDDDLACATEIVSMLPPTIQEHVIINTHRMTHEVLISQLSECDVSLCTRMHMCILSLLSGTPVLPIAYEFKTKELFKKLGQGDVILDMESIDGAGVIAGLKHILQTVDSQRTALFQAVEHEYTDAMTTGNLVAHTLDGRIEL